MSDRLSALRRQRALLQEHIAWLDAEITDAEKAAGNRELTNVPATPKSAPLPLAGDIPARPAPGDAETLLDEYRLAPEALKSDVRKGCFLYFALAFAVLFLGIAVLWFALRR